MAQNLKRSAKNQQINDNKIKVEEKIDCFLSLVEAGKKNGRRWKKLSRSGDWNQAFVLTKHPLLIAIVKNDLGREREAMRAIKESQKLLEKVILNRQTNGEIKVYILNWRCFFKNNFGGKIKRLLCDLQEKTVLSFRSAEILIVYCYGSWAFLTNRFRTLVHKWYWFRFFRWCFSKK